MISSLKFQKLHKEDYEFINIFKIHEHNIKDSADKLKISDKEIKVLKDKYFPKRLKVENENKGSISYLLYVRRKWKSKYKITKIKDGGLQSGVLGKEKKIKVEWPTEKIVANFWDFYDWYADIPKRCHYCCITEDGLTKLYPKLYPKDNEKREDKNPTRGRTLEIDRLEPNKPYSEIDNLVFSCYWCNNAKTDTFDEVEGQIIGKAIRKIWVENYKIEIKSCYKKKQFFQ